jgi:hypothetical protein
MLQEKTIETKAAPLVAELESYRQQYEAIRADAQGLVEGLTEAQFNWRNEAGRWSIAECLAHLNATGQVFLPRLDRAMKRAREEQRLSAGPYRHGFIGNFLVRQIDAPIKRLKTKSPKMFAPMPEHLSSVVVPAFATLQEEILRRIEQANGLDLGRVKIASPISKLVKLSLGQWFAFIAAHERRHLWQARQMRNHAQFPRA